MQEQLIKNYHYLEDLFLRLRGFIHPGVTENEIFEFSKDFLETMAGESINLECCIGTGENSVDPDCQPTNTAIKSGDVVLVDFFPCIGGVYCDMTRIFLVGDNPAAIRYAAKLEAIFSDINTLLRPDIFGGELDSIIRGRVVNTVENNCYSHHTGHGLSSAQICPPLIAPESGDIIKVGDVIAIEPGIYLPEQFGLRFENTYIVTQNAPRCLNSLPFLLHTSRYK